MRNPPKPEKLQDFGQEVDFPEKNKCLIKNGEKSKIAEKAQKSDKSGNSSILSGFKRSDIITES